MRRDEKIGQVVLVGLLSMVSINVLLEPFLPDAEVRRSGWFAAIVVAPVLEELFFRGVAQRLVMRVAKPWGGIFVASLLFAAAHGTIAQVAVALPCGMVLGYAYFRSRTLLVPISIHVLNNALAWFSRGVTLREIVAGDTLYWIIYGLCAGFLTINIIFVLRR